MIPNSPFGMGRSRLSDFQGLIGSGDFFCDEREAVARAFPCRFTLRLSHGFYRHLGKRRFRRLFRPRLGFGWFHKSPA